MAEPSDLTPNQEEVMEENVQPEEENRQEETTEGMPAEALERPTVPEEGTRKGKEKVTEEEVDDFVSEEAHSNMRKYYANKGFVAERRFKTPITPFKELIEKRGWGTLCAHRRAGYAAVVREFYSNLVGRKDNMVYVRGVWVPYGAKAINQVYGMAGQKHGSKFKKLLENPDFKKIAEKLTDGKAQWRQEKGGPKALNRGSLTEEAKVWFYFLASVLVPTRHLSTVREQEAIMLYAILKGYKINIGTIIENLIMRYHEESSRGTQGNNEIIEMLLSMQRKMEEREQRWNVQQQFRDNTYEVELKRRD